ncbi:MAG: class I SAM-dependent methyltransferase [Pseudomonadota bacterium]|nr:class I SAM-dependent methyltransferase [Pseudomonadota bacterium]
MSERFFRALARDAARRYPAHDRFARHFAFGKLCADPVFQHFLTHGLIHTGARVLDLGSGQGLLSSLLIAARARHASGDWPELWPTPPTPGSMRGIDLMQKDVDRAREAADATAHFVCGDICDADFGVVDAIVILDVLHYIDYAAQQKVLERARESLATGGVLIVRVGDQSASMRFRITVAVDRAVTRLRGHRVTRLYCKPVATWKHELERLGFKVQATTMSTGTPFANTLLVAHLAQAQQCDVTHMALSA